jgi:zinc D-Ala-D-Ala carboxypeptidase
MYISEHITYHEAVFSQTAITKGIQNIPDPDQLLKMKDLAENIFEPLRKGLGDKPIFISSFFRCKELNNIISNVKKSQHINGEAFDLNNTGKKDAPTNAQIFFYIKTNLNFDQLIWEFGNDLRPDWVHVSFVLNQNRKQVLKHDNDGYKLIYG